MQFTLHTARRDMPTPCVFMDRDGTVNVDKHFIHRAADWEWTPGAREAILACNRGGFLVVVVSNQSGIARGMFAATEVDALHDFAQRELQQIGAHIDAFYYCPHAPEDGCDCRKPSPKMLRAAASALTIDLSKSWMIGDKLIDVEAGLAAGLQAMLVRTGYGVMQEKKLQGGTPVAENLSAAIAKILDENR